MWRSPQIHRDRKMAPVTSWSGWGLEWLQPLHATKRPVNKLNPEAPIHHDQPSVFYTMSLFVLMARFCTIVRHSGGNYYHQLLFSVYEGFPRYPLLHKTWIITQRYDHLGKLMVFNIANLCCNCCGSWAYYSTLDGRCTDCKAAFSCGVVSFSLIVIHLHVLDSSWLFYKNYFSIIYYNILSYHNNEQNKNSNNNKTLTTVVAAKTTTTTTNNDNNNNNANNKTFFYKLSHAMTSASTSTAPIF